MPVFEQPKLTFEVMQGKYFENFVISLFGVIFASQTRWS